MSGNLRHLPGSPSLVYAEEEEEGVGPTLLLLHGVCRCAADFQPVRAFLDDWWRVVALDQRGHGGSQRAASYLVQDYVSDAVRFLSEWKGEPLFLLGHSLGAMVAAAAAACVPERVAGVVLEDPPFHTMGARISGSVWEAQFRGMQEVAKRGGGVEAMSEALAEVRLPNPGGAPVRLGDVRTRASLEWSARCLAQMDPEVLTPVIGGRWLEGYDPGRIAAQIRCPVVLLQGDPQAGGALSGEEAGAFAERVAVCKVERFEGSGHLLHWVQPQRVAEQVNALVRAHA